MGIVRIEKSSNYTVMSNYHLRDKSLSLKAKGLMSLMLSLPEDWDYSIAGLVAIVSEGETAVRGAITELVNNKYLTRERVYENGKIVDWNYTLYEMPTDIGLPVENQQLENLVLENQAQINKDINKIKTNKSTGAGALSKKHPRNFSKEKLTDDLESGKDIDEQKKEKKKTNKFDSCLAEIDKRDFTENEKALLRQHLNWSFHDTDSNRNNEPKKYAKRLDTLLSLKGDRERIIQASIDRKWHCFYDAVKTRTPINNHECFTESIHSTPIEEARAAMEEKKQRGAKIY